MVTIELLLGVCGVLVLAGGGLFLWMARRGRQRLKQESQRRRQLRRRMEQQKAEDQTEIRRLERVVEAYRRQTPSEAAVRAPVAAHEDSDPLWEAYQEEADSYDPGDVRSVARLKTALEEERSRFQEKSKQLWDQSIAIHREKEHVDRMKREIESRHRAVTDSILYARRIQNALLPHAEQLREALPEHGLLWRPRDIVSGDFFWVKTLGDRVVVMVADCTGHGVPGAFMSMLGMAFLNEIVHQDADLDPALLMEALREKVKTSLRQAGREGDSQDGMDAVLCVWDRAAGQLHFSGAKNPLFHLRDGTLQVYKGSPNPVGYYPREKPFRSQTLEVNPGDTFYAFSDGFIDQFGGPEGKRYRSPRFRELIGNSAAANPDMNAQAAAWDASLQQWMGEDYEQLDDILVLGFRVPED